MIMRGRTRFPVRVSTSIYRRTACGFWIETPDGTLWAPGDWGEQRAQLVRARGTARDPPVGQLDGHRRLTAPSAPG